MLPFAAMLAPVALVWGMLFSLRGPLIAAVLAALGVNYVLGHNFVNFQLGPLPMTLDRLAVGVLLGTYVVQRLIGKIDVKRWHWVDYVVAIFTAMLVFSTFTHDYKLDVPGKISPIWLLVAGYLIPAILYFTTRDVKFGPKTVVAVYASIAALGAYLAFTSIAEITQQWWAVFPRYIADPKLGIHFGRARGPQLQSQSLGFYLGVCWIITWALAWRSKASRGLQLAILVYMPILMAAIFFSYTRCSWLGAALGTLIVMTLALRGKLRVIALGGTVGLGILVGLVGWSSIMGIEREAGAVAARDSVTQRGAFTYVSWKMFQDRPFWGVGFGQFTLAKAPYLADRSVPLYLEVIREQPHHNTFLCILTETGVIGLTLFLSMLGGFCWMAWKLYRNESAPEVARIQGIVMIATVGVYICPALFFDLAYSPQDHWLLFMLAGLTSGLYAKFCTARNPSTNEPATNEAAFARTTRSFAAPAT